MALIRMVLSNSLQILTQGLNSSQRLAAQRDVIDIPPGFFDAIYFPFINLCDRTDCLVFSVARTFNKRFRSDTKDQSNGSNPAHRDLSSRRSTWRSDLAGWSSAPFAVLLVTPEYEFLIRHPAPSPDFTNLGHDRELGSDVLYRRRTMAPGLLATFPAIRGSMVSTIVVGQAENTLAKTSTPGLSRSFTNTFTSFRIRSQISTLM